MPLYEYRCQRCGKISIFLENAKTSLFKKLKRKCTKCGDRRLDKVFSSFAVSKNGSAAETLSELSRMGPVNFVPDYRPQGPPPGGCPYAKQDSQNKN